MKKKNFLVIAGLLCSLNFGLFAAEQLNYQNYELDMLLHEIKGPTEPIITDEYIIFTADPNNRFVGIAFDFENYQVIHSFQVLSKTDDEGNTKRSHLFYCFKREHKLTSLKYRLVIDGLWVADPLNPNKEYDENVNLYFSKLTDLGQVYINTEIQKDNTVRFIYKGETGQKINLAGNFCNWDPWIYELQETSPGLYELQLPLPKGKYLYSYYIGLTPVLDNTNSNKMYTKDGRIANVIEVN